VGAHGERDGGGGNDPAEEVDPGDAEVAAGLVPDPVAPADHLGVEEEIPGGEGEGGDGDEAPGVCAAGDGGGDGPGGREHHEPGDGDDEGDAAEQGGEGVGVVVGAEGDAGGAADAFDEPGEGDDDGGDAQGFARTPGALKDDEHGGGLEEHAGDHAPVEDGIADDPADDGDGDHREHPGDDRPGARVG
jgi:hypothetical protein